MRASSLTPQVEISACVLRIANSHTSVLNGLAVRYFGITEFYLSIFKVFLMLGLMAYTFITMVGGNPNHDAYGFRYWKNPVRTSVSSNSQLSC